MAQKLTVTEALAEIKTLGKQIEKKSAFVISYLARQEIVRDPFEKDGGSFAVIASAEQSITDLHENVVRIRSAIQAINQRTPLTIEGDTRSVAEWLNWRREVAPKQQAMYADWRNRINNLRQQATQRGGTLNAAGTVSESPGQQSFVVNVDEKRLAEKIEHLELVFGRLDGALSLHNATMTIEV